MGRRAVAAWLLVAACILMILTLSGEGFGMTGTSRIIGPLLRWLFPEMSGREIYELHVAVRRAAHVIEYAMLGFLAYRALRLSLDLTLPRIAGLTLLLVAAVAGIDELRQSFLPDRTGAAGDVLLDLTGGALGVVLLIAIHRWFGVGAPQSRKEA